MKREPNLWITLAIAMVIALCLSLVLPKKRDRFLSETFWVHKTIAPSNFDLILMGDSRVYRGISPEEMKTALPEMRIFNFGYSNGGLNPTMFKAAENKLSKSSKQKVIVMGITANSISGYTQNNDQYEQERTRPREEMIERLYFNPIRYWFSPTSPEELKEWLANKPATSYYINDYHPNGWVESEKFPIDTMEAIPSYISDFTKYQVDPQRINEMMNQVKAWTLQGINVFGFRPPIAHPLMILEDTMALFNETEMEIRFENAGGVWLKFPMNEYKTYDGSHMEKASAQRISRQMADSIKLYLRENSPLNPKSF